MPLPSKRKQTDKNKGDLIQIAFCYCNKTKSIVCNLLEFNQ